MRDARAGASLTMPVSEERDHVLGTSDAPVTLVEYGDYECPHCRRAHFILHDLMKQMGERVRIVFRNFPLKQIHPHAWRAAEAAEAAGAQQRFWEYHDTLYERQDALEDDDLLAYAQELGLDVPRFQAELAERAHEPRVRQDFMSGVRSGVNGTPTFFINSSRYDGSWDLQPLAAAITSQVQPHHDESGHDRPHL